MVKMHLSKVLDRVENGPKRRDGTVVWSASMLLWWRTWATSLLLFGPLLLGTVLLSYLNPLLVVWITGIGSILSVQKAMAANPKYNVSKNY